MNSKVRRVEFVDARVNVESVVVVVYVGLTVQFFMLDANTKVYEVEHIHFKHFFFPLRMRRLATILKQQ